MSPKVSIITVTYNAEQYIQQTIKSVLKQDYPEKEFIIIDGESTDATTKIISKYNDFIDYWVSEPDTGIYDAMNKAIKKSTGEWLVFLNAGDMFASSQVLINLNNIPKDSTVIYGDTIVIDELSGNEIYQAAKDISLLKKATMPFTHQSTIIHRNELIKYYFRTDYTLASDYDLFLQLYLKGRKFHYLSNVAISKFLTGGVHELNMVHYTAEATNSLIQYWHRLQDFKSSQILTEAFETLNNNQTYFIASQTSKITYKIQQCFEQNERVIIYGYGNLGKLAFSAYKHKVIGIIDKSSDLPENINRIYPESLSVMEFDTILVTVLGREEEIINFLKKHSLLKDKIYTLL